MALPTMDSIARADGDLERARRLLGEGLIFSAEIGDGTNVSYYLEGLSSISASEGDPERAARLWGAAEAILEKIEVITYPHAADRSLNEEQLAAARESLDERAWEEAWTEGRAMTTEEAVAYALEATTHSQYACGGRGRSPGSPRSRTRSCRDHGLPLSTRSAAA